MSHSGKRERIVAAENIIDLLDFRGKENPNKTVYQYLKNGEVLDASLTFSELHQQVKALAGLIQKRCRLGDRVLLLYPSGLDYIVAFFACLYAGVIAVPAYPPQNQRRGWDRLQNMITDCDPSLVLSSVPYEQGITQWIASQSESHQLQLLISDELDFNDLGLQNVWVRPDISAETIAFLQYSSGSTGTPKGVMVSHGNLLHNLHVIQQSCNANQEFHVVSWLPIYHDMGLIGNVVSVVYFGGTLTLLAPIDVIQKPLRWLKAITDYRAAASGGPSFIYDLCIQQITEEQKAQLDLSSWRVAFNGAEPINAATMLSFSKAFSHCGLSHKALLPCYGLAENTLMVSSKRSDDSLSILTVDANELKQHRAKVVNENQESTEFMALVSSGNCITDQEVCIVDPNTLAQCVDNQVGEIWVHGDSVAKGYWDKPELSSTVFQAKIAGDNTKSYLRTGDYGFLYDAHLYVTGRIKELIIIRGQNHYPQDIEVSVQGSSDYFRRSGGAAFSVEVNGEERLVVIQELTRQGLRINDSTKIAAMFYQAQLNVTQNHQLKLHDIVLVKPGSLSKTTSGKIQRFLNRENYLTQQFDVRHSLLDTPQASSQNQAAYVAPSSNVEMVLCQVWQKLLTIESVGIDDNFFQLGGDSLLATRLIGQVNQHFSVEVTLKTLFELPTIREFSQAVSNADPLAANGFNVPAILPLMSRSKPSDQLLETSFAQQRLWLLGQIDNGGAHYNIPATLTLAGVLNLRALNQSFREIIERHQSLRTRFTKDEQGRPYQVIQTKVEFNIPQHDLSALKEGSRQLSIAEHINKEADLAFDLSADLMLRAQLLTVAENEHVLLVTMHHIAADGWSMSILMDELRALYGAFVQGKSNPLLPLQVQYIDYAHWQRQWLQGDFLAEQLAYWEKQLTGLPVVHNLPLDHPRPQQQTFSGKTHYTDVSANTTSALNLLCQQRGATLFMGLHAAFSVLLARHSNDSDIAVGTPIANREQSEVAGLIGFFVNTLVLRSNVSGDPSFNNVLDQSKAMLLDAYSHQQVPFEQVVDHLQPERSNNFSPLFQVMLVLQNNAKLQLELPDLQLEILSQGNENVAKYDLTLNVIEQADGLKLAWEYSTDLFAPNTIVVMAEHFTHLLEGMLGSPEQSVFKASMLTEQERHQQLFDWNNSQRDFDLSQDMVTRFEQQVERTPEVTAMQFGSSSLTYLELNQLANQLAHYLIDQGLLDKNLPGQNTQCNRLIALSLDRDIHMLACMLAVQKAGYAYLPIDPAYPKDRQQYILDHAEPIFTLTPKVLADILPHLDTYPIVNVTVERSPEQLAYTLYTSGSTGKPKGVQISHGSFINFLLAMAEQVPLLPQQRWLAITTIAFDISGLELFLPLISGATVVLASREEAQNPQQLLALLEQDISIMQATPATWRMLLDYSDVAWPELHALCGGEALSMDLANQLLARKVKLLNLYGPTETTVWSTFQSITQALSKPASIGQPLGNNQCFVLNDQRQMVPVGTPGELYIGGQGLSMGYLKQKDLSDKAFIVNPFCHIDKSFSGLLYRTGDRVCYRPDGCLEYLGRNDFQVKIRGFRIELGEIESVIAAQESVREALVVTQISNNGEQSLVAYVTLVRPLQEDWQREMRRVTGIALPAYMVPSFFVSLMQLPLTPNGKVDRNALPEVNVTEQQDVYVEPRNPREKILCDLWQDVLGLERVGIHDNFFQLGGHSLLATGLVSRIRQSLNIELPLRALFDAQTPEKLVGVIAAINKGRELPPLVAVSRDEKLLPSYAQQRLWVLDQIDSGSTHYHMPGALKLSGVLNHDALNYALRTILERHQSLRTCFIADANGEPEQVIRSALEFKIEQHDLSLVLSENCEQEIAEQLQKEALRPFDLGRDLMLRARLIKVAETEHILGVTLHHIAADGWSITILVKELCTLYRAYMQDQTVPLNILLAPLDIQYGDYAQWQRKCLQGELLDQQMDYWKAQLADLPVAHNLPFDYPRPPIQSFNGASHRSKIKADNTQRLQALCRQQSATLFMGLHAVFSVLLARYSNEHDIVIGTPIANREQAEVADLIGFFVNTLVLRSDLSCEPSFDELLTQSKKTLLDSYDHQQAPFEQLVDHLQPERSTAHGPLFQVMLSLQNNEQGQLSLPELTLEMLAPASAVAKCDLTLEVSETEAGLSLNWEYNTDLFKASTIAQMAAHFEQLLTELTTNPQQNVFTVDMLTEQERHQQLFDWNNSQRDFDLSQDMVTRFEQQVERTPEVTAMQFGSSSLTYLELNQLANQLAHYLIDQGLLDKNSSTQSTECNHLIALSLDRNIHMLACMLAVQKAGFAYLPIDPNYPQARQQYILDHAEPIFTLTPKVLADILPHLDTYPIVNVTVERSPEQLAYTLYTSGSTGKPKGVQISHGSFINFLLAMAEQVPLLPQQRWLAITTIAFDISGLELFLPLISGATVVLASREQAQDPQQLLALLEQDINIMQATPATWRMLLDYSDVAWPELYALCGGEALSMELANQLLARKVKLLNLYGPTETTVWSTFQSVTEPLKKSAPIGQPLANNQCFVLNDQRQLVPVGTPGELYIGGQGLAMGYLKQKDLSDKVFIENPFFHIDKSFSGLLYRTGDRVCYRPDGCLEYLGRNDFQVKIRGFRIELGEIESVIAAQESVREALVVTQMSNNGEQSLVAYVTLIRPLEEDWQREMRRVTGIALPAYMVPSFFVSLMQLPLTPNGKVDRNALPAVDLTQLKNAYVAPKNEIEITLCEICQDILQLDRIGMNDNFFLLGGNSLLAVKLVSRIEEAFQIDLALSHLFDATSIADLVVVIDNSEKKMTEDIFDRMSDLLEELEA